MIKLIGCLFIILSSSGLGYILGGRFGKRVREIKLLMASFQMLENEIIYSSTPLPEAFESVSKKIGYPVNALFKRTGDYLNQRLYTTAGDAFKKSLGDMEDMLSIAREDMEILVNFGHTLGSSDTKSQEKNFKMLLSQLDIQEGKAHDAQNKNEKMYKNLGFLSGLAIAIIFI